MISGRGAVAMLTGRWWEDRKSGGADGGSGGKGTDDGGVLVQVEQWWCWWLRGKGMQIPWGVGNESRGFWGN